MLNHPTGSTRTVVQSSELMATQLSKQALKDISHKVQGTVWDLVDLIQQEFAATTKQFRIKEHDQSPVSLTDLAVEEILKNQLPRILPGSSFLGEESAPDTFVEAEELFKARYIWVVDPIDGTTNFLAGIPVFALSIGLLERFPDGHRPVLGVIAFPALNQIVCTEGSEVQIKSRAPVRNEEVKVPAVSSGIIMLGDGCEQLYTGQPPARVRMVGCTVADFTWAAIGRADLAITRWHCWDFMGALALASNTGRAVFGLVSHNPVVSWGVNNFQIEQGKNNWVLKEPVVLCAPEQINLFRNN